MKRIILFSFILIIPFLVFSQVENSLKDKKLKFGINMGINQSFFRHKDPLPNGYVEINKPGFNLGILMDYKISEKLSFSPKLELGFNENSVHFVFDGNLYYYSLHDLDLNFSSHLLYRFNDKKTSPYVLIGSAYKYPISNSTIKVENLKSNADLTIDFGFGVEKVFSKFIFSPELRYSLGLLDINKHPTIKELNLHTISLFFNFSG